MGIGREPRAMRGADRRLAAGLVFALVALCLLPSAVARGVGTVAPVASFSASPESPLSGDAITFTSTSTGAVSTLAWDLDADGQFNDASGPVASTAFATPGAYTVTMAATDSSGATTVASQGVAVAPRPPTMLQPFPVVRLTTKVTRRGARVLRLGVVAPPGSRVTARCRGRGCGTSGQVRVIRTPPRPVSFPALQHRMRAGVVLEVSVTAPGKIGKYTRFRLRRAKPPSRVDLCLAPGQPAPALCPPG